MDHSNKEGSALGLSVDDPFILPSTVQMLKKWTLKDEALANYSSLDFHDSLGDMTRINRGGETKKQIFL